MKQSEQDHLHEVDPSKQEHENDEQIVVFPGAVQSGQQRLVVDVDTTSNEVGEGEAFVADFGQLIRHEGTATTSHGGSIYEANVLEVPRLRLANNSRAFRERLLVLNDPEASFEEKQGILEQVGYGAINQGKLRESSPIEKLSSILREASVRMGGRKGSLKRVQSILHESRIPAALIEKEVGNQIQRYGIVCRADHERIVSLLRELDELQDLRVNPVSLLAGEVDTLPTSHTIIHTGQYITITRAIGKSLAGKARSQTGGLRGYFDLSCPVPVFGIRSRLYVHQNDKETVRAFIEEQLQRGSIS